MLTQQSQPLEPGWQEAGTSGFLCVSDSDRRVPEDRGIGGVRHVAPPTWLVSNFLVRPASS